MREADHARLPAGWSATSDALKDRIVLVTGAAGGLGKAAALAIARAGGTPILLGRKPRTLERLHDEVAAAGAEPAIYPLDLEGATPRDYEDMAAAIERDFGRLDGIVNCAAHFSGLQPAAQIEPMDWLRTLHVNLSAPFLLLQACLPLLQRAPDASVVFVIDDPDRVGKAHWGAYGVAKHALAGMVSILHQEWDCGPLRVHALLPPPLRTALRRTAYFGENSMQLPAPDSMADALVYLLAADGAAVRGKVLDLRAGPKAGG
ncbi:MAG TPA: SDR family NAD(P)-dependent oxidoreductase [Rudaea sp.]|nr:SDR family NAD(P)-dependent oxidoreductase [Rudaea sp.]